MALHAISNLAAMPAVPASVPVQPAAAGGDPFSQLVSQLITDANGQQLQSNEALNNFVTGRSDNVQDLVLSVAKADLSFRLVLEIRNRLIDAYQDVMRMQM
jgi:flagellar hook-basal body complex protein FliE